MQARLWFARLVAFYALLIFSFLAWLYIAEPLEHITRFGISADSSPESINFLRAGPGALFLGMAITALYGLARPRHLRASLTVLVLFNACVVAVRLLGIGVDGSSPIQLTELRDEGISWLFFVAALLALPGVRFGLTWHALVHGLHQAGACDGLRSPPSPAMTRSCLGTFLALLCRGVAVATPLTQ